MRVLVFGGVGFIGASLVKKLHDRGYEVYVAHRGLGEPYRKRLAMVVGMYSTLVRYSSPSDAIETVRPELVYNLVGEFFGKDEDIVDANTGFVDRLSRALGGYSVKLVHISAATVVGPRSSVIYEEDEHLRGIEPITIFDRSKAEGERIVSERLRSWVIVRPTLVYGAYNAHPEWVLLLSMVKRRVVPSIKARISAIDVTELAEILVRSAELEREFFFATECEPYIVSDFVEAMEKALSVKAFKIPVPAWLARVLAPDPLRKHMAFLNRVFSCNKMLRLTGYRPRRRLAEGVAEMTRWIMETRTIAP
jgi:nucleoside-diphosphate-sugar epimerase